jgi:hypothetical protein
MTEILYENNGLGKANQYPFRLFDSFVDGSDLSPVDLLISPDKAKLTHLNNGVTKTITLNLPSMDNLFYVNGTNKLTTNTTLY